MMTTDHVPSHGAHNARYAAVGQAPRKDGDDGLTLAREWLRGAGIDPDSVYYLTVYEYVLPRGDKPTATEVKHGIDRVKRELAALPNLEAVILFGSYAARMAFSLKGGITRAHGRTGTIDLPASTDVDARTVSCIACLHPGFITAGDKPLRQRQQIDSECRAVVARLRFLDQPLVLPDIRFNGSGTVSGVIGLDTETGGQVGTRPDPRRDPLLITGLSDGRVIVGAPTFAPDAEPIVHNVPFDPVVVDAWRPRWHDSKVIAHLVGEPDTIMKSLANRVLGRPMMDYDPDLRARASTRLAVGDTEDPDVQTFSQYCVARGTRVLTADMYWTPIERLRVGQSVWGVEEYPVARRRRLTVGVIERISHRTAPCYLISTNRGSVTATAEHPWLVKGKWVKTCDLAQGDQISYLSPPTKRERSWASGYLAGMFDGDGTLTAGRGARHLMLTQNPGKLALARPILTERGYDTTDKVPSGEWKPGHPRTASYLRVQGGGSEIIRFLAQFHPLRLVANAKASFVGRGLPNVQATVQSVAAVGVQEVWNLQTSCRTFVAEGMVTHNCVQDALAHHDLFHALYARADEGTRFVYDSIERPMLRLYSRWTKEGVFRLDREAALLKRDQIDIKIREMRGDLIAETGVDSPNKHAKLALALGLPSTAAAYVAARWPYLNQRQRKVLRLVGALRSIERQVSTYIDAWLAWFDPLLSTNWRPTAAWTGRPGSAALNLQNIPGPCGDCKVCRRGTVALCPFNLKELLLAPEGYVLYEADNSQAELRVAAHVSQDTAMIEAFTTGLMLDGDRIFDLHTWAQHRLGFASRREAKIRVLATFYGQGTEDAPEKAGVQEAIRQTFSGYMRWSNRVKRHAIVPGLFGRTLYVPPHANPSHREREAINAPSQGGAVDILKLQTLALEGATFNTRHMIHDSTLILVPDSQAGPDAERGIRETMESAVELSVPLKVEVSRWPHY